MLIFDFVCLILASISLIYASILLIQKEIELNTTNILWIAIVIIIIILSLYSIINYTSKV